MKKGISILVIITMLIACGVTSHAEETIFKNGGFVYRWQDPDTATVVEVPNRKIIRVKNKIKAQGYNVRIIGMENTALKNSKKLKKLYINRDSFLFEPKVFTNANKVIKVYYKSTNTYRQLTRCKFRKGQIIKKY